jgi:hypothetical protein
MSAPISTWINKSRHLNIIIQALQTKTIIITNQNLFIDLQ